MRLLALIFVLSFMVACGKESSSGSASGCNGGSCEGIQAEQDMNNAPELLEAKIDTTVKMSDSEIVFLQDASHFADTVKTDCSINVRGGDRFTYTKMGETLEVYKPDGKKYSMKRMSYTDDSLAGSWAWRGYEGNVYKVLQYTFVGTGRIIMRLHCES